MDPYNPEDNTIKIYNVSGDFFFLNLDNNPLLANEFRKKIGLELFEEPDIYYIKLPSNLNLSPKMKTPRKRFIIDEEVYVSPKKVEIPKMEPSSSMNKRFNVPKGFNPFKQLDYEDEYEFICNLLKDYREHQRLIYTIKWIIFKQDLDQDTIDDLIIDIEESGKPKDFLDDLFKSIPDERILALWYMNFNPKKFNAEKIVSKMVKYSDNPWNMWNKMYSKYF